MTDEEAKQADDAGDQEALTINVPADLLGGSIVCPERDEVPITPSRSHFKKEASQGILSNASIRKDHFRELVMKRIANLKEIDTVLQSLASVRSQSSQSPRQAFAAQPDTERSSTYQFTEEEIGKITKDSKFLKHAHDFSMEYQKFFPNEVSSMEIRVQDFSMKVKVSPADAEIKTVYNQSALGVAWEFLKRTYRGEKREEPQEKVLLDRINLAFRPGRMYLVLGDPGTGGKEILLKAIAGRLKESSDVTLEGTILYNGLEMKEEAKLYVANTISYVDKIDFHAPRLTVKETFDFAFQCFTGGTHAPANTKLNEEQKKAIGVYDKENSRMKVTLEGLGLDHVADTFVGNSDVRGVSGGQRRRVSCGEMTLAASPILCGDEISTGLDAASTYDICHILMLFSRVNKVTRVLSLLQPSPETVSLFDELILMADGKVLFAGPIAEVELYFSSLGYRAPDLMDVADFLQELSTPDGKNYYDPDIDSHGNGKAYSIGELADKFRESQFFETIKNEHVKGWRSSWVDADKTGVQVYPRSKKRFQNSFLRSTWLNLKRNLTIWSRDKRFLIANAVKNVIMGISVGGVFYQTTAAASIFGVCFQINLFIMLGAMTSVPEQVSDRIIYYKHHDANFYGAFPYVIGKSISLMPQAFMDVMIFGTIIYWMVGLTAAASNYFIFIAILFTFSIVMNQMLSVFAAIAKTKTSVQGLAAVVLLFLVLFCGFIVNPDVIPNYYIWIYYWNPLAWAYRAMLVNEFRSDEYNDDVEGSDLTEGELILLQYGFREPGTDVAFGQEWVAYCFAYLVPHFIACIFLTVAGLVFVRIDPDNYASDAAQAMQAKNEQHKDMSAPKEIINVPVKPVNLTFEGICYDVQASKGSEKLRLLSDVSAGFTSSKMVALMGSSGAGKTTLMDVIAMRKSSGEITGKILVNGFPQELKAFRRITGYVEQFDVQSPELTVRETVIYAAKLKLDPSEPLVATDEAKEEYVDSVLKTLELSGIANCLVGSEEEGGLSFEQRKRLSIAVELAGSPSIMFLDEPTSGLDGRAAAIVVSALRHIADTGRTIIATIHQPSLAVFEMFDQLLLLKKGGQAVFFGDLGEGCKSLIDYFEGHGAPKIELGENPANWMLKVITAEDAPDYADIYATSTHHSDAIKKIAAITSDARPEDEIKFETEFAATRKTRQLLTNHRFRTIYFRSPAYNLTRVLISMGIAFILGSVFVSNRFPAVFSETELSSIFSCVFISFIIIGVLSITSVLPVMLKLRDSYYRHRQAGLQGSNSVALALGVAEKWFIVISSALFTLIFIGTGGFHFLRVGKDIGFWGFFTFNLAIYSYFGQAFMCLVRGMGTAQILASVFIGINNFFSGLIVRPQYLTGLFAFTYWITPGHYVYEGLLISLFRDDDRLVNANDNSEFFNDLGCTVGQEELCQGTVREYLDTFFGGKFNEENIPVNIGVLALYLVVARLVTFLALKYCRYTST